MRVLFHRQTPPYIPVITLADIAWQIIIFFLVASTFARNDVFLLDLPGTTKQPQGQQPEPILVVAGSDSLTVNGAEVAAADLQAELQKLLQDKKTELERSVVLTGKEDLTYQQHLDLMYTVQKAGGYLVLTVEE